MHKSNPKSRQAVSVGLIQLSCAEDLEENFTKSLHHIRAAATQGAQIICLQELFRSRYFCQREDIACFDLAEEIPGPSTKRLGDLARELKVVIIASLFEKRAPGVYHNSAVIIDSSGNLLGKYRKMHIPDDPYYHEKFYFTPGDLGFQSFSTPSVELGVLVCWDQWFPEAAQTHRLERSSVDFVSHCHWMVGRRVGGNESGSMCGLGDGSKGACRG